MFYAAFLISFLILASPVFPPPFQDIFNRISQDDIYWEVREKEKSVFLGGVIISEVETRISGYGDPLTGFVLEAKKAWIEQDKGGKKVSGRVKCYLKRLAVPLKYGDEIVIRGDLRLPPGLRNPGGFDQSVYLARQRIRTVFYGDKHFNAKLLRRGQTNFVYGKALEAKHFLSDRLSRAFEKNEAAFLKALFLGERSELEEDFTDLFIKTGTMHILAVSGFNIGFLCAALFLLLYPFPVPKNVKLLMALITIWLYCAVVGWQAPVVRASLMASVFFMGQLLGRKADALNSLGLAACVILVFNPQALFDVGFQLSFLAVFGIVCFVPLFLKRAELLPHEHKTLKERVLFYLKEIFWVSFVCLVVTLPVTVQNFYIVTPLSVLSNLAVVPLSFLLFLAGVLFFLSAAWTHSALGWIPFLMSGLMKLFVAILKGIEQIPGAYFIVGKLGWPFFLCLVLGISYLLANKRIKNRTVRAAVILLFLMNVFCLQEMSRQFNRPFRMTVLDVGQGDSIYFEFPQGGNMLVDAGKGGDGDKGRRVIAPFLKSKGVRSIDFMIISHPQEDHIGGLPVLFDEFRIKRLGEAGSEYPTELFHEVKGKIKKERSQHRILREGGALGEFKGVAVQVLGPAEEWLGRGDVNNESLVLKLTYGSTSFLLTGDIGKEAMAALLEKKADLSATVLKAPHHGAKFKVEGERFVKRVNPKVSVISVGARNPFHHPSQMTLDVLSEVSGSQIFRTDRDGAVEIVSDGRHLDVNLPVRS